MAKYKHTYRIETARAQWWDYSDAAAYFVTICTAHRQCFFGEIADGQMRLSEMGKVAAECWSLIPQHFHFASLEVSIIMPNHIHGIVVIEKSPIETRFIASASHDIIASGHPIGGFSGVKNPMLNDSLSKIIRWYKGRSAYQLRKTHTDFAWHPRFYDHIIRNPAAFSHISDYISNNPARWEEDKFKI